MKILCRGASLVTVAFLGSTLARANVLVVDAAGGGSFTQIQAAVDAAQNGDTILVKSGTYSSFFIANKALAVVGDANANVVVNGGVEVRSLIATRDVMLANMTIHGQANATDWHANGLYLKSDLGSVRIRCNVYGGSTSLIDAPPLCAGAQVSGCADVAFESSLVQGGFCVLFQADTGAGIIATHSSIAVYDTTVTGSRGTDDDCYNQVGSAGGAGAKLTDSFLFASNATFLGGNGGNGAGYPACGFCQGEGGYGGDGGAGLALAAGTSISEAEMLDSVRTGGYGGVPGYCGLGFGQNGANGPASSVSGGSILNTLPGSKRVLSAASVVRELAPLALTYQGQPGDEVGMLIAPGTGFHFTLDLEGVKLIEQHHPAYAAWLGFADPSGHLVSEFSFPDAGAGAQSSTYYLQAIVRSAQGTQILGSPISVVVLDPAF